MRPDDFASKAIKVVSLLLGHLRSALGWMHPRALASTTGESDDYRLANAQSHTEGASVLTLFG